MTAATKLGRHNPPSPLVGDTNHAWRLEVDATGEWSARYAEIQAPLVNVWPVSVTARLGTHPVHLATALRALADHLEENGVPVLDGSRRG